MKSKISPKLKQEFNKNWKKATVDSGYQVPETIEDFKSLGPFPYFKIKNIWIYPKDHTRERIIHFTSLMQKIVGDDLFSRKTVYEAILDEIKLCFSNPKKETNEWHLSNLVKNISSKSKRRLFVRAISGLQLENIEQIKSGNWRLLQFDEKEIDKFVENESGNKKWKSHVEDYLKDKFEGKVCLFIETEGDLDTAKNKAHNIATYVINTLRYFICIHICHTGRAHDVGIDLDISNQVNGLNAFSVDLQERATTIFGFGSRFRQKYPLHKEYIEVIRGQWHAEKLWSLIRKEELTDLEASIVSSITWLGDAHQENDLNAAYVKYWIAIEALITGHKKGDTNVRLKNSIPIMISQITKKVPSKTEVDNAYDLRCEVVHCGNKDLVSIHDLNKVCVWATQCLSLCIHLSDMNYVSRDQIENQININIIKN